jgi:hypothetical protein
MDRWMVSALWIPPLTKQFDNGDMIHRSVQMYTYSVRCVCIWWRWRAERQISNRGPTSVAAQSRLWHVKRMGISKRMQQANTAREEPATSTNVLWGSLEKRGSTKTQLKAPSRSSRGPARLSGKRDQYPCLARILDLQAEPRNADNYMDAAAILRRRSALLVVHIVMISSTLFISSSGV